MAHPGTGVLLGGRATSLPCTAVLTGPERTITDNAEVAPTCATSHLCRRRSRPSWWGWPPPGRSWVRPGQLRSRVLRRQPW